MISMAKHKKTNKLPHPPKRSSQKPGKVMCIGEEGSYKERSKSLNALGYRDYKEYLFSDEWKKIRKWVLRLFGGRCSFCTHNSGELHHSRYDIDTMAGNRLDMIYPVCHDCHQYGEFDSFGMKHGPWVATQHMKARCIARFGYDWLSTSMAKREEKHEEWISRNKSTPPTVTTPEGQGGPMDGYSQVV